MEMADLPLLQRWLTENQLVKDIYAHGRGIPFQEVVAKYAPRIRGETPTTPYLILYGEKPIGYIQTYLWRDYPDYSDHLGLKEEAASIDLFIGEEEYLHKGLGAPLMREFLRKYVFGDAAVQSCVVTPEVRNESALRAYVRAGFKQVCTMEHPDEPGPICVIRMGREDLAPPG